MFVGILVRWVLMTRRIRPISVSSARDFSQSNITQKTTSPRRPPGPLVGPGDAAAASPVLSGTGHGQPEKAPQLRPVAWGCVRPAR